MGKYYLVQFSAQNPRSPIIINNWAECQTLLKKETGGRVKSFKTEQEANDFLNLTSTPSTKKNIFSDNLDTTTQHYWHIYTDGSFNPSHSHAGWGWVAINHSNKTLIHEANGVTEKPAESRNIDGELTAVTESIKWLNHYALKNTYCEIEYNIHYDYQGISSWYTKEWKAKSKVSQNYVATMQKLIFESGVKKLRLRFTKVTAHSGDCWNERADELAKLALNEI